MPAATVTLARRVPSMCARNSWVNATKLKPIAGGYLGSLHAQNLHVALQPVHEPWGLAHDLHQILGVYPETSSFNLNYRPGWAGAKTDEQWQADETVPARQPDFHAFPLGQNGQHRG